MGRFYPYTYVIVSPVCTSCVYSWIVFLVCVLSVLCVFIVCISSVLCTRLPVLSVFLMYVLPVLRLSSILVVCPVCVFLTCMV